MSITLSTSTPRPRIETALVTVGKLIKKLTAPAPEPTPARRERRWMNG